MGLTVYRCEVGDVGVCRWLTFGLISPRAQNVYTVRRYPGRDITLLDMEMREMTSLAVSCTGLCHPFASTCV